MFPWQQTQNNSFFLTILTIILDFRSKLHQKQYFIQNIGTTIKFCQKSEDFKRIS